MKRLGERKKKILGFLFNSAYILSSGLSLAKFASSKTSVLKISSINSLNGCPNLNKILCFLHIKASL